MNEVFTFDVFLSYSSKDRDVVRDVANRLRKDGLKVWFDEWILKPGDSVPAKIDEGLEQSRVLVFCMSANAFGSDWSLLEAGTFRFRDPINKERRFIPLRLDEAPVKGSLAQFLYISWRPADRAQQYSKLLEACQPPAKPDAAVGEVDGLLAPERSIPLEPKALFNEYAFSSDQKRVLTGDNNKTARFWDLETGRCLRVLKHDGSAWTVALTGDGNRAIVAGQNEIIRIWDVHTGDCLKELKQENFVDRVRLSHDGRHLLSTSTNGEILLWDLENSEHPRRFKGHAINPWSIAWSTNQLRVLSGDSKGEIRLWDIKTENCLSVFKGHTDGVTSLVWSNDDRRVFSGSMDKTVRLWDVDTARCLRVLEGHTQGLKTVTWHPDQRLAVSGSYDGTVRLWEVESGDCLIVIKGHNAAVRTVVWSIDGCHLFSGDMDGYIHVWDLTAFVRQLPARTLATAPDQIQYTNAKVLLVGDSGVGKTGLSNYLARDIKVEPDKPLPSTDGAWATHWPLRHDKKKPGVEREIWLWDFAGQVDYRLVHQLYMEDTAAAVLVFNPQNENPFEGLGQWDRDLQKAARKPFAKLLVAARVDRGGLTVSANSVNKFMTERGFVQPLHLTSAMTGEGCKQLRDAIVETIDWKSIPETTSPALYHRLKQEILNLRDNGLVLLRFAELNQRMEMTLRDDEFETSELEAVVGLLSGPGMIQRLDFGGFILLRPEVLSRYAAAVVRKVRQHPQELGCIREDDLLAGHLDYQDFQRIPHEDEAVVLRALLETFVSRAWCLRQSTDGTAILTFPSYFRRERPEKPTHPNVIVTYRFDGPTDEIYATLVVRLHHTVAFESTELWKSAADFRTQTGAALGFTLTRETEGTSRLEVYFEPEVDQNSRVLFLRYIHNHLLEHAKNVVRLRNYSCTNKRCEAFGQVFSDQPKITKALASRKNKVFCPDCGKPIVLRDLLEEKFDLPETAAKARELEVEARFAIEKERRELILNGHALSIAAEAGEIYRGYIKSDHGIDGEIEFKDNQGRPSGKRLYVHFKLDDTYLRLHRYRGPEILQIRNPLWTNYWQQQTSPVMVVLHTSNGEIRWMDVSAYLKRESTRGWQAQEILFDGELFDARSVSEWRKKLL
jgi:WD40 repeat protein